MVPSRPNVLNTKVIVEIVVRGEVSGTDFIPSDPVTPRAPIQRLASLEMNEAGTFARQEEEGW